MNKYLRRSAIAAGLAALGLASNASWAASYTYTFNTFFDTSTPLDLLDTKTLNYSVGTLTISDIAGGVSVSLSQTANDPFPAKTSAGTTLDALWINGPKGTLSAPSGTLGSGAGYQSLFPVVKDAGYTYNWNLPFASGKIAEGGSLSFSILGTGVNAAAFTKGTPMIDLAGVGSPYTGFLGLNSSVHFIGKLQAPLPEPGTYVMMALGLVGIGAAVRRRAAA